MVRKTSMFSGLLDVDEESGEEDDDVLLVVDVEVGTTVT